jgi:hypothetical protein
VRHRLIQPLLAVAVAAAAASSALATNLVVNGDFEGGNTGFTSDYSFAGGNTTEAQYTVRSNPYPWNSQFISAADHTSGSGLMYVGNGSPRSELVWQSASIAVTPNTDYFFEAFVMNVCCSSPLPGNTPSILEFSVSGLLTESLGTATTNLASAGTWEGLSKTWNSGSNTTVTLSLINRNTGVAGNDFAIDDINFGTTSIVPEPATPTLLIAGLVSLGLAARRLRADRRGV